MVAYFNQENENSTKIAKLSLKVNRASFFYLIVLRLMATITRFIESFLAFFTKYKETDTIGCQAQTENDKERQEKAMERTGLWKTNADEEIMSRKNHHSFPRERVAELRVFGASNRIAFHFYDNCTFVAANYVSCCVIQVKIEWDQWQTTSIWNKSIATLNNGQMKASFKIETKIKQIPLWCEYCSILRNKLYQIQKERVEHKQDCFINLESG